VLVTLPEPLPVVEKRPVDVVPGIESDPESDSEEEVTPESLLVWGKK
jgi:hypothetical protein